MMLHKYEDTKRISVMFHSQCGELQPLSAIRSRTVWQIGTNASEEEEMSPRRSIKFRSDMNGL